MVIPRLNPTRAIATLLEQWNALGVDDALLASALAIPPRTLSRWRTGTFPQTGGRERIDALAALLQRLLASFGDDDPEALRTWLHADNRFLGGLTPVEALKAGRFDRVAAACTALDEGFFV